jgi:hypothetical protein
MFEQEVYVPSNFTGKMGNGDAIKPGVTFLDIRSKYKEDPDYARLEAAYEEYKKTGEFDFTMTYHRFWAQCDYAVALGTMDFLFNETPDDVVVEKVDVKLNVTPAKVDIKDGAQTITGTVSATAENGTVSTIEVTANGEKVNVVNGKFTYTANEVGEVEFVAKATTESGKTKTVKQVVEVVNSDVPVSTGNTNVTMSNSGNTISAKVTVTADKATALNTVVVKQKFTATGVTGTPVVYVDNVAGQFTSAPWYLALTADTKATITALGNNEYELTVTFTSNQVIDAGNGTVVADIRICQDNWANFDSVTVK